MKRILLLAFLIALGFTLALSAEDLGALAKKEKARREALAKEGKKAKVLTNQDVADIKSDLAYQSSGTETPASEVNPSEQPPAQSAVDDQIKQLQDEREQLQQKAQEGRDTIGKGGLFHTHNVGTQYQQMEVQIDEPTMKEISRLTDGKYFRATDNAKLKNIYAEIDELEKTKIEVTEFSRHTEEFLNFALLAGLLFAAEIVLRYTVYKTTP